LSVSHGADFFVYAIGMTCSTAIATVKNNASDSALSLATGDILSQVGQLGSLGHLEVTQLA